MTGSAKTTRREFLTKACELSAAGFVTAFAWGSLSLRDANARWMPRPPGAVDGKDFLALCSRCGQCVTSCPYETLRLAGPFDPAPGGTPFFVPEEIPCYMCKDTPCVKACPTDAWDAKSGYLVSFGGLFGNRIHKGEEILPVIESEEDLFRVTDAAIQFFDDNANPSERFRFTIERVGEDKFIEKMKEAYHG